MAEEQVVVPEEKKVDEVQPNAGAQQEPAANTFDVDALSDEEKDKMLARLTGGKIKSRSELETPVVKSAEELAAEAEKRKTDAFTWAIESGKIKKADYDKALVEKSKSNREIALSIFTSELQAEDKDITAEDAEEMFRDTYHEDKDPDTKLFKIGQKEMNKQAEAYRKEKFSAIDNIEPEYDNYTKGENNYSAYKKQVKAISAELPEKLTITIPFKGANGEDTEISYEIPVDEKVKTKILNEFIAQNTYSNISKSAGDKGIDEKALAAEITYHIKARMFDEVLPKAIKESREQEREATIVYLGNKQTAGAQLNNGTQNTRPEGQKFNDYSMMHNADSVKN